MAEFGLTPALVGLGLTVPPLGAPVVVGTVIASIGKIVFDVHREATDRKPRKKEDQLLTLAGRLPVENLDVEAAVEGLRAEQARIEALQQLL